MMSAKMRPNFGEMRKKEYQKQNIIILERLYEICFALGNSPEFRRFFKLIDSNREMLLQTIKKRIYQTLL